jgi:hypothetical protein
MLPHPEDGRADPAMTAGGTNRLWAIGDIVRVLEDREGQRASRMRSGKREKLAFVNWLVSPAGTRPMPYLRSFEPQIRTKAMLWFNQARRGRFISPAKFDRIYVPSAPFVKAIALRRYARTFGLETFVETGTFRGETTAAVADLFQRCFTIELSGELHARAVRRFSDALHVVCLQGDSGVTLSRVLNQIAAPALFWLDAHHSGGDTANAGYDPIFEELASIYRHPVRTHVILVDDARGHDVARIAREAPPSHELMVRNDIVRIRIFPRA